MSSSKKAIVFGSTGAVGSSLVEQLSAQHADWDIRAVTRNVAKPSYLSELNLPNVTMVQCDDVFDKAQVIELSKDCDLIYCCIGFVQYERKYWAQHWPVVVDNLLAAVVAGDKKRQLVFCDNLYAYGPGENISSSTTPVQASNKSKPAVRAGIRQTFQAHMKEHPGTLTVVGGADFFGPRSTNTSFLGDTVTGKIVNSETALAVGSVDKVHDFCFSTDFATAMMVASTTPAAYDRFLICPHAIHGKTLRDIAQDIAVKVHGETAKPVKFSVLTKPLLYILSPFMGFAWEMLEMLPFWTKDYTIDDSEFVNEFGVKATPYDEALQQLVDFYQSQKE